MPRQDGLRAADELEASGALPYIRYSSSSPSPLRLPPPAFTRFGVWYRSWSSSLRDQATALASMRYLPVQIPLPFPYVSQKRYPLRQAELPDAASASLQVRAERGTWTRMKAESRCGFHVVKAGWDVDNTVTCDSSSQQRSRGEVDPHQ